MSPRNALPPRDSGIVRPMDRTLDSLTETELPPPGTSVTRGTGGVSGARTASGTRGTSDTRGTSGTANTGGNAVAPGTSDTSTERKPLPRQHVKVRSDLADEVRAAVWFLSERGRPRVQLGELLDEALEEWLAAAKKLHNEGRDFPDRGRLR